MYICIYIYKYVYINMYVCIYIYTHTYTCTYIFTYIIVIETGLFSPHFFFFQRSGDIPSAGLLGLGLHRRSAAAWWNFAELELPFGGDESPC